VLTSSVGVDSLAAVSRNGGRMIRLLSKGFDGVFEGNATSQTDPFFRGQIDALVLHQSRPHCVGVPDAPKGLRRIPTRMNR